MDPRKAKGPEAPKALLVLLFLFLPAVLPAQTPTPTDTFTATYTFSVTRTFTRTPTWTQTWTPTTTFTNTLTVTPTPTTCLAGEYTCTPTWYDSPTSSPTISPTPTEVIPQVLDDFYDEDLFNLQGGAWAVSVGGAATVAPLTVLTDTPYEGANTLSCGFQNVNPSTGDSAELRTALVTTRDLRDLDSIVLAMYADRPVTLRVLLESSEVLDGDHYGLETVIDAGWNYYALPVSLMSQQGTGAPVPPWQALADCTALVARVTADTGDFLLQIMEVDLYFRTTPLTTVTPTPTATLGGGYLNSAASVAAAMGCSEALVNEVRTYNLTPQAMYIILRLCARTGISPAQIMALRANMGWDDICRLYGISWSDLTAEVTNLIHLHGLRHEPMTPNQIWRTGAYRIDEIPNVPRPSVPPADPLEPYHVTENCP